MNDNGYIERANERESDSTRTKRTPFILNAYEEEEDDIVISPLRAINKSTHTHTQALYDIQTLCWLGGFFICCLPYLVVFVIVFHLLFALRALYAEEFSIFLFPNDHKVHTQTHEITKHNKIELMYCVQANIQTEASVHDGYDFHSN